VTVLEANLPTLAVVDELVADVLAPVADAVDQDARFPDEAIAALGDAGLLGAAAPATFGGPGYDLRLLAEIARRLGRGCGATSMIWAMHEVQVATVVAGTSTATTAGRLLRDLVTQRGLIASVTSETGVGGDLRTSRACVESGGDGNAQLEKKAPTVSYALAAEALLVTARREPQSPPDDQVAVLVTREDVYLEPTSGWDPMGMRGTQSPGFVVRAQFAADCVLERPFAELAHEVMIPLSHVLWASCWLGLAEEAFSRTVRVARARRLEEPRLADAARLLTLLEAAIDDVVARIADREPDGNPVVLARYNDLKVSASLLAVDVVEACLEVGGMAAFQERGPNSVTRMLRDLYSARLMIANARIAQTNARFALLRGR